MSSTTRDMDPDDMPTLPAYTPRIREEIMPDPIHPLPELDPRNIAPEPEWDPARSRTTTERLPSSWLNVLAALLVLLAAACGPEVEPHHPRWDHLQACFAACDAQGVSCGNGVDSCRNRCVEVTATLGDACLPESTAWYECMAVAEDANCSSDPPIARSCGADLAAYQSCAYGGA